MTITKICKNWKFNLGKTSHLNAVARSVSSHDKTLQPIQNNGPHVTIQTSHKLKASISRHCLHIQASKAGTFTNSKINLPTFDRNIFERQSLLD